MTADLSAESRILGGLWDVAVGDALGVPVEFRSRAERERDPVVDLRGHGTHNQPPGTWSDDTSLTLCTVDTLVKAGEDYQASAARSCDGSTQRFGLLTVRSSTLGTLPPKPSGASLAVLRLSRPAVMTSFPTATAR